MRTNRRLLYLAVLMALAPAWTACSDSLTGPQPVSEDRPIMTPVNSQDNLIASLQATPDGYIRIGVVESATQIRIGAAGGFTVTNKATGTVVATGSGEELVVELLSAAEVRTRAWLQVTCTGLASTRDALVAAGQAAGFETDTEDLGFCTRVMYGSIPPGPDPAARAAFQQQLADAGLISTGTWHPSRETVEGETEIQLTHQGGEVVLSDPLVLESEDQLVSINGGTYRGIAEVWTNGGGTLAGINEVPLEEYLYGVVPRELPPGPYGLPEAQKAQAVAARTYALASMGSRGSDGYDVVATTGHQVYGGYQDEHPVSTAAVDATAGIVAVHNGTLITTLYHSTSGGWTANSEDVYANAVPYLRGVPDAERGQAIEQVPSLDVFMRNANPTNLRAKAEGDFESDWSGYHRWMVDWTLEDMAEVLSASFGAPITEVYEVRVEGRSDHGRVQRVEFDTDAGEFGADKDAIRWHLRYKDIEGNHRSLRSTLFFIEPVTDEETGALTGWKAYGGGWGHGVGMSQTGAVGMAERGRSYEDILKHYYRGIELEQRD